jgi:hypothetical protein
VRRGWVVAWVAAALPLVVFYFELRRALPLFTDGLRVALALALLVPLPALREAARRSGRRYPGLRVAVPAAAGLLLCTFTPYAAAAVRFHAFRAEYGRAVEAASSGRLTEAMRGTTYARLDTWSHRPLELFFAWHEEADGPQRFGMLYTAAPQPLTGSRRSCRPVAPHWYFCTWADS